MRKDTVLDFYCSDHDDICCKSCIADEHRTCGKIKPLDVAAKGIKSATMFEDFSSEFEYLIDTTSKVREQKQKSKVTWNLSTDSVRRGVQMFRLIPFAATSNGFIFPHVRCSSAMHDLQQISS
jgi:hypothetical protein